MKSYIKIAIYILLASFITIACQDDSVTENNNDALGPTSQLTAILTALTANESTEINVIDSTACFNIKLPVGVVANGQQITVSSENDYAAVEAVFNQSNDDIDQLTYVYPITVVYANYSEFEVGSEQEYNTILNACNFNPQYISSNCVAINFPITVFGYNSGFQMENTYELTTDAELYNILLNLSANEYYAISYPITLTLNGQQMITVNSNTELEQAIVNGVTNCSNEPTEPVGCQNPGVLTQDLVIYMPFSNNVYDLKGAAVTAPADTTFVADRNNNAKCAISFNGSQSLQIASTAANALVDGDELSISLWFRMQNTVGGDFEALFSKSNNNAAGFYLAVYDGNTPMFGLTPNAPQYNQIWDDNWNQDPDLWQDTTNWHHLVITLNVNYEAKLYRDGILQNTEALINGAIGTDALAYFIGQDFTGYLDDLRVYKKVLSATEVQTLFELEGDCNTCLE
ncbi:LamG domain-containing protein [Flavobacterium zepuense]|uniref:LamG domain-containing protein n=1 Tax=Flavobacterium zepuense TaxID=2593302 RepID=A0A552V2I9_9FLAO|nr:LamG domain-containing protein [Flavobacterium zepuense]TRW24700.1 LamG domain-containing protein [Flavobacterium zepuense]